MSNNQQLKKTADLCFAALQELDPRQLILFVQSFGIPVSSMSCLLKCLDNTAESDPNALHHVVTDPAYIAKLIHIQHLRGVTTGEKFYSLLTEGGTIPGILILRFYFFFKLTWLLTFESVTGGDPFCFVILA